MQNFFKNRKKLTKNLWAFFATFLLHFLLFVSFFDFDFKSENQPVVALEIELITPGKAQTQNQRAEKIRLQKNTHQPSDHVHLHEENDSIHSEQIDPILHPLPEIPDDLRDEAFSSRAVARFHIGENGEVAKVDLIQPCSNPRLNVLLLKSLQKWKFPRESSGKTQEISVTFLVK